MDLKGEIGKIKERNKRVEADKAWETSLARKAVIAVLTYLVIVLFFLSAGLPDPFINPIVPTVGFVLSTLTLPVFKNFWLGHFYKK
jgi:hypothetical protein